VVVRSSVRQSINRNHYHYPVLVKPDYVNKKVYTILNKIFIDFTMQNEKHADFEICNCALIWVISGPVGPKSSQTGARELLLINAVDFITDGHSISLEDQSH
jgi:hypothetical protein